LGEVLAVVKGKVTLLCELKGEGTEHAAVDTVKEHGMSDEVVFTSFQTDRIQTVKRIDDGLSIGAILPSPGKDDIQKAKDLGAVGFGVNYRNLCLRMVEEANDLGLDIRAWNPDTLPEQKAMIGLGVDGISTNRPDILMSYLAKG
jgi:glycerophosphoryl diester phosphodiesterase